MLDEDKPYMGTFTHNYPGQNWAIKGVTPFKKWVNGVSASQSKLCKITILKNLR